MKTCPNDSCKHRHEKLLQQRMNINTDDDTSTFDEANNQRYALTQPSNNSDNLKREYHTVSAFDYGMNTSIHKKKYKKCVNECPGGSKCKNYKQAIEMECRIQKLMRTVEELTKVNDYFKFMLLQKDRMYQILVEKSGGELKGNEGGNAKKGIRNENENDNANGIKRKKNPYEKLMEMSTRNQKHNLQNSSGVSFLALSDERLHELISNPSLNNLYQLTLSDEVFIKEFTTADNDLLISYCDIISSVTKDYQTTLNLIRRIKHFMSGSIELVNSVFLDNSTSIITSNTNRILECENTSIYIHDSFTDMLIEHTSNTTYSPRTIHVKDTGIIQSVFTTGERIKIDDTSTDSRFPKRHTYSYKIKNLLCYPLIDNDGDIFGVIEATNKRKGCFDNNDEEILSCYSKQASGILQHIMNIETSLTQINKLKDIISYQIQLSNSYCDINKFVKSTEQIITNVFMSSLAQVLIEINGKLYNPSKKKFVDNMGIVNYVYKKKECHGCSDVKHCKYYNILTDMDAVGSLVTYPIIEPITQKVIGIIQTKFNSKLSDKNNLPKQNEMMLFILIEKCFVDWVQRNHEYINNLFKY